MMNKCTSQNRSLYFNSCVRGIFMFEEGVYCQGMHLSDYVLRRNALRGARELGVVVVVD